MKTLPTHPCLGGFHPVPEEPKHPVTALFAMGTRTLFYTPSPPPPPSTALPPHILAPSVCRCRILHKIMSWEPHFPLLPSTLTWV